MCQLLPCMLNYRVYGACIELEPPLVVGVGLGRADGAARDSEGQSLSEHVMTSQHTCSECLPKHFPSVIPAPCLHFVCPTGATELNRSTKTELELSFEPH